MSLIRMVFLIPAKSFLRNKMIVTTATEESQALVGTDHQTELGVEKKDCAGVKERFFIGR
jgi:hypothetical protein